MCSPRLSIALVLSLPFMPLLAAAQETASVSGTVTSQSANAPLQGVEVKIYRFHPANYWEQLWEKTATTATDGSYAIGGLAKGNYRLEFKDPSGNYAPKFYGGASTVEFARSIAVEAGAAVGGIDEALADGATISGTVTSQSANAPLQGVQVTIYRLRSINYWEQIWEKTVTTATDGSYAIGGLAAGNYRLEFKDPGSNYAPRFYGGASSVEFARTISVEAGAAVGGIDEALADGATISGTITSLSESSPLQGVQVSVYRRYPNTWYYWEELWSKRTTTASDGSYSIRGLPAGSYRLGFTPPGSDYAATFYGGAAEVFFARSVALETGAAASGVDQQLADGATISGTVTSQSEDTPLEGVQVIVYRLSNWGFWEQQLWDRPTTITGKDGSYTIGGLAEGNYRLEFKDPGGVYAPDFYDSASPIGFAVEGGSTIGGINVALANGGTISGTVTSRSGNIALQGVQVSVFRSSNLQQLWEKTVRSEADGTYTIGGLPAGTYRLGFSDDSGSYAPQFFNDRPTIESAADVVVSSQGTVNNINASLADGATIRGTVRAKSGNIPLQGAQVSIYRLVGGWWQGFATFSTDADGNYVIGGLTAGTYRLGFADANGKYAPSFYSGAPVVETAADIVVSEAGVVPVDVSLADEATISGRVTSLDGTALATVQVEAIRYDDQWGGRTFSAVTDGSGNYTIGGLPPGSYRLLFRDTSGLFAPEYYENTPLERAATIVTLEESQNLTNVDAALARAAVISGRVTRARDGLPLQNIEVTAKYYYKYPREDQWGDGLWSLGGVVTDEEGNYAIKGLPAGTYRLEFRDYGGHYVNEIYNDSLYLGSGQSFLLAAGDEVNNVDISLTAGATIKGTVTSNLTGAPLDGVRVDAYRYNTRTGEWEQVYYFSPTGLNGSYTLKGLPAGSYRIGFIDESGGHAPVFSGNAASLQEATTVNLIAEQTVEGINAALNAASSISGTVTAEVTGLPLAGVQVTPYLFVDGNWEALWHSFVVTDEAGRYSLRGLSAGAYRLDFRGADRTQAPEFYNDKIGVEDGSNVVVGHQDAIEGVDVALSSAASVSGKVTDSGGQPLREIEVLLLDGRAESNKLAAYSLRHFSNRFTDAEGFYALGGVRAGTYRMLFRDPFGRYAPVYHDGSLTAENASVFSVDSTINSSVTRPNVVMAEAATIAGTVTRLDGSALTEIEAIPYHWHAASGAWKPLDNFQAVRGLSDRDGRYVVSGLAPGTYRVALRDPKGQYATLFPESAQEIVLAQSEQASLHSVALARGASISGKARAADTQTPLANVRVWVYRQIQSSGAPRWEDVNEGLTTFTSGGGYEVDAGLALGSSFSALTDANGDYTFSGLPAGVYRVGFYDNSADRKLSTEFYPDSHQVETAGDVILAAAQNLAGIDAYLQGGAVLSGSVVEPGGGAPQSGSIYAEFLSRSNASAPWNMVSRSLLDPDGTFSSEGLPAGDYILRFQDVSGAYANTYFSSAHSVRSAQIVSIDAGESRSLGSVQMGMAAGLSGRITDSDSSAPLRGAYTAAYRWSDGLQGWERVESSSPNTTSADGVFHLSGLPAGVYKLQFGHESGNYLSEFYNDAPNLTAGGELLLTAGQARTNVDAGLMLSDYHTWRVANGLPADSAGSSGSDPDGDGLSNAAERALGTNPMVSDREKSLHVRANGTNLVLEFLKQNQGSTHYLEETTDLTIGSWTTSAAPLIESPDQTGVSLGYTRMRSVVPAIGRKFFRIKTSY